MGFRQERVTAIDGSAIYTASGQLTAIGHQQVNMGDWVWTDGRIILGNQPIKNQPARAFNNEKGTGFVTLWGNQLHFSEYKNGKFVIDPAPLAVSIDDYKVFLCQDDNSQAILAVNRDGSIKVASDNGVKTINWQEKVTNYVEYAPEIKIIGYSNGEISFRILYVGTNQTLYDFTYDGDNLVKEKVKDFGQIVNSFDLEGYIYDILAGCTQRTDTQNTLPYFPDPNEEYVVISHDPPIHNVKTRKIQMVTMMDKHIDSIYCCFNDKGYYDVAGGASIEFFIALIFAISFPEIYVVADRYKIPACEFSGVTCVGNEAVYFRIDFESGNFVLRHRDTIVTSENFNSSSGFDPNLGIAPTEEFLKNTRIPAHYNDSLYYYDAFSNSVVVEPKVYVNTGVWNQTITEQSLNSSGIGTTLHEASAYGIFPYNVIDQTTTRYTYQAASVAGDPQAGGITSRLIISRTYLEEKNVHEENDNYTSERIWTVETDAGNGYVVTATKKINNGSNICSVKVKKGDNVYVLPNELAVRVCQDTYANIPTYALKIDDDDFVAFSGCNLIIKISDLSDIGVNVDISSVRYARAVKKAEATLVKNKFKELIDKII